MKHHVVVMLVLLMLPLSVCLAQDLPSASADIPFSFVVEGKTLPAGAYLFTESSNATQMTVRNQKTGQTVIAMVITRISAPNEKEAEVVFDVTGNDHYLSEVLIPGVDGYLLKATPGKHTHSRIKAKK